MQKKEGEGKRERKTEKKRSNGRLNKTRHMYVFRMNFAKKINAIHFQPH